MTRRTFFSSMTASAAAFASTGAAAQNAALKGRLKQAATLGCFGKLRKDFEEVCRIASKLGLKGIDLVGPKEYPILKKYGLLPTMLSGGVTLTEGVNHVESHAAAEERFRGILKDAVEWNAPNIIALSGNRRGISEEQGMDNTVTFLNKIKAAVEDKGITVCLELLNSKVDHKDYQCDHTAWGVEVCRRVNSPRVKLLYDIYHMQIMEGDIIRTIRQNIQWIGHFHTAGNPGRHELDATQELNYRPIAQAIVDAGYTGYLAHEYGPLGDPLRGLEEAIRICDV
jgi:hydroxypyruvate isomerase